MAYLTACFQEASSSIEPEEDAKNAKRAHEEVRPLLEANDFLNDLEVNTLLIGSYGREVSIRRVKDVDVFVMLSSADASTNGDELLSAIEEELSAQYGTNAVTLQQHSVNVELEKYDLCVDAVPARPCDGHWEIPAPDGRWVETDPLKLGELTTEMNKTHAGIYVPTVKFMRQIRRAAEIDRPSGLYFEILTYWAFKSGAAGGSTRAEYLATTLDGAAHQLENAMSGRGLIDPALPQQIVVTKAEGADLDAALMKMRNAARLANDALADEDPCESAKKWRELLGKTPDGEWVFPMPEECDEETKSAIYVPGEKQAPRGTDRFA